MALVRLGIGQDYTGFPDDVDWPTVKTLADQHGLSAIVLDGINVLNYKKSEVSVSCFPSQQFIFQWIGEMMQNYETRYQAYKKTIGSLAGWYHSHGIKMMVLKGYACALDWPKPEHRPCGDIDIWQFGKQKEADAVLKNERGVKIDNSHHHHKSNVEMELILKELGQDDSHYVELYGEKVYLPSPNLHALFLLRHSMSNFASTGFQLRQLLDWAFLVEKHGEKIDWVWLENTLERFGMKKLYDIFNAICVGNLGFDVHIFPQVLFNPALKDRVLNDILSPEFLEKESGGFLSRAVFKFRRWRANTWKHELCFNDSMWSAFWSGVWGHLMKPSTI